MIALGTVEDTGWGGCARVRRQASFGAGELPITEPLEVTETRAAVQADVFGADGHRRCCCGSVGRPSMPTRYRPRRAAIWRKWLLGSTGRLSGINA